MLAPKREALLYQNFIGFSQKVNPILTNDSYMSSPTTKDQGPSSNILTYGSYPLWMDGWVRVFTSFSTVFQSFRDDRRVKMKGSVELRTTVDHLIGYLRSCDFVFSFLIPTAINTGIRHWPVYSTSNNHKEPSKSHKLPSKGHAAHM